VLRCGDGPALRYGVQAWIAGQHHQQGGCGRIALEDNSGVFADGFKEVHKAMGDVLVSSASWRRVSKRAEER
jgi:hypothetical protein